MCDSVLVSEHDRVLQVQCLRRGFRRAFVRRSPLLCRRRIVAISAALAKHKHGQMRACIPRQLGVEDQRQCAAIACRNSGPARAASADFDSGPPWRERPLGRAWGQTSRPGGGSFTPRFTIDRHQTGGTRRRPSSARPWRSTAEVAVLRGVSTRLHGEGVVRLTTADRSNKPR